MSKPLRSSFLIICCALLALSALAEPTQKGPELPAETVKMIESLIQEEMSKQNIPGMSVALEIDGQVRYAKGFGMADLENSVPVKNTTAFRTASLAKPLTATAVMQLVEKGKIDLDAPIQQYCQSFPTKPWPVTARQILGHLSGIRHYKDDDESSGTTHYYSLKDTLKIFKDDPLLFEPGTKFYYSTFGYSVLGCAIEGASGIRYEDYMRQNIFEAAGMDRTQPDDQFSVITERAHGYMKITPQLSNQLPEPMKSRFKVGQIYNAALSDTSMKIPGGGFVSTSIDLVNFGSATIKGKLVKETTLQQMWTAQKTKEGKDIVYGLGWVIGKFRTSKLLTHSGGQAGASTLLLIVPDKGIAIAAMSNLEGAALNRMLTEIAKVIVPSS